MELLVSQSKEAFDLKKGNSAPPQQLQTKEVEMVEDAVFIGADKQSYGPFRPTNTTKNNNPNTTTKNPFSVARDNSQSSVFTRYTASQRASSSLTNCRRIRMRISDIHFREVNADDIIYLMGNDGDFKPQVYHDQATEEQYDIDLSDWRESLRRLCVSPWVSLWNHSSDKSLKSSQLGNQNNNIDHISACFEESKHDEESARGGGRASMRGQGSVYVQRGNINANRAQIIEYVRQRKIVGVACFYQQEIKMQGGDEHDGLVRDRKDKQQGKEEKHIGDLKIGESEKDGDTLVNNILIGMILLHVHQPKNDSSFPEALRSLPIFQGKVRLRKENPVVNAAVVSGSQIFTTNNAMLPDRKPQDPEQSESVSTFFVDSSTQVANILMLAVVPQCRRSGIGTLLYKKALSLIESQFTNCVLIYGQRNDALQLVLSWKAVSCFLVKNHFKVIEADGGGGGAVSGGGQTTQTRATGSTNNGLRQVGSTVEDQISDVMSRGSRMSQVSFEAGPMAIFYYPITSLVRRKDQQRSTKGLFREVMRAFCRNPFAHCNREGRAKFKKELEQIKKKYEKDDIYLDVEKFASDEEDEAEVQVQVPAQDTPCVANTALDKEVQMQKIQNLY
ncbi:hypothetical protein FGO68_gene6278 [Halteria grandinella]|uniref:Uncharacterized protein n=1 Tax=Halteria grandinella TaxID=5974 RepID=A0A8J8NUP7_HALGN|nr:hypothetical protein FGO68_gene6278 [Halteria grandinella]